MYDIEALYEAETVSHAVELLKEHQEAVIIAGGSDVLIKIREGKLAGKELVSIYMLDELRGVVLEDDGTLRIKPLTSFSHITKNEIIQKYINVLGEAVDKVGGPQIRNIGTIGGNTCNGVTSADSASTLHAYDAIMEITGANGVRQVPIQEFYISAGKVDLNHDELLTSILIRKESYDNYFGHYIKYAMRNAMDIATTGCSANVKLSQDKKHFVDVRVAYGVAAPCPVRAVSAEAVIKGRAVNVEHIDAFAKQALNDVNPRTSWRASKELRLQLIEELTRRAISEAVKLAGGEL